jgi:ribonuclease P protein component
MDDFCSSLLANTLCGVDLTISSSSDERPLARQSLTGLRLCKHADYQRAYAASRKRQSSSMSWFLAPQQPAYAGAPLPSRPRVGLTAGKVMGKAHERNRLKRRMREVLRRHTDLLPTNCDLILHPRRTVLTVDFTKLEAEVVRILHQAKTEATRMGIGPNRDNSLSINRG